MLSRNEFIQLLKHPEMLDQSTLDGLKDIIADYPAFAAARMLYLRNLSNISSYKFESELQRHAIAIPDREVLYRYLTDDIVSQHDTFELLPFDTKALSDELLGQTEIPKDSELELATAFDLGEELPGALPSDKKTYDLIERFINENPTIRHKSIEEEVKEKPSLQHTESLGDGLITETLAGVYLKQGLYTEALNAYQKLSLKFPEKNTYFATQIAEIKKLMSKES